MTKNPIFSNRLIIIFATGLVNLLCYFQIGQMGDLRQHMPVFFLRHFILAGAFLFLVFYLRKTEFSLAAGQANKSENNSQCLLILILSYSIIYRILVLFDYPFLTDDIFRYIWDGRVWGAGINPFLYAPNDPALFPVHDTVIYPHVNHPHIPTIYAPVLQILFRITAGISASILAFKILVTIFDLAVITIFLHFLARWKFPQIWILIYAWNPLVIIETSGSGHIDGIGVFFLLLSLLLFEKKKEIFSSIVLGLAILVKFIPLIIFPFTLLAKSRRQQLTMTATLAAILLLGYAPFLDAGTALFKAMFIYAEKWRFNDSIFFIIYEISDFIIPESLVKTYIQFKNLTVNAETLLTFRQDLILLISKGVLGVFFLYLIVSLYRWLQKSGEITSRKLMKVWFVLFGSLCLITPTLHPWYLLWILPITIFHREKAWLVLSLTIVWSYEIVARYATTGIWQESGWIKLAVFTPFYALLLYEIWQHRVTIVAILKAGIPARACKN
ncbi:MAG: DUF2029 domain-containing protein [Calditrichaeota bacterium]|nr:MAG: DUF2029 domain-containing protein [Calditrichota bacterium]